MKEKFISLFISFFSINVFNRLIPLVTIPILTNRLGLEGYGEYILILSYTVLFDTLISFGFKTTAVIDLNFCKSKEDENKLFFKVLFSKLMIAFPSIFILLYVLNSQNIDTFHSIIFCVSILMGVVLNQEWYFHGKGNMHSIVLINVSLRLIYIWLIYEFIKSPSDYTYALIIHSLTLFLQSFVGGIKAVLDFKIEFPKSIIFRDVFHQFKNNTYFFSATLSSYFTTSFNFIILDNFYSPTTLGVYAIADKLVNALRDFSNTFNNSILPILAEKHNLNQEQKSPLFLYYIISIFLIFSIVSLVVYLLSDYIFLFFNSEIRHTNLGSRLIETLVIGLPMSVIIGAISQFYVIKGKSVRLFWIFLAFAFLSVITLSISAYYFNIISFAYTYVILMIILFTFLYIKIKT